jgi:hypothetical protein
MIIIERTSRTEVATWEEARKELTLIGILLPNYAATNIEAGRPLMIPTRPGSYMIVKYESDVLGNHR